MITILRKREHLTILKRTRIPYTIIIDWYTRTNQKLRTETNRRPNPNFKTQNRKIRTSKHNTETPQLEAPNNTRVRLKRPTFRLFTGLFISFIYAKKPSPTPDYDEVRPGRRIRVEWRFRSINQLLLSVERIARANECASLCCTTPLLLSVWRCCWCDDDELDNSWSMTWYVIRGFGGRVLLLKDSMLFLFESIDMYYIIFV